MESRQLEPADHADDLEDEPYHDQQDDCVEHDPDDGREWLCDRDQGEKLFDDKGQPRIGYKAGFKFISAKSKNRPGIVDRYGVRIDDDELIYALWHTKLGAVCLKHLRRQVL